MIFDYPDWSSIHHKHWKPILDEHLDLSLPVTMIEVGCFEGRSTVWFAEYLNHHPDSRMFCIDTWLGGEEVERVKLMFDMPKVCNNFFHNVDQLDQKNKILKYIMQSERALATLFSKYYRGVDFIYLDGSHTQKDTLVDLTMSLSLLAQGGVIIVDDYLNNMATKNSLLRPKDAVDFVVKSFDNEIEFSITPEQQAVIIRK
jgi:predicted O-methyltransferase YrrM